MYTHTTYTLHVKCTERSDGSEPTRVTPPAYAWQISSRNKASQVRVIKNAGSPSIIVGNMSLFFTFQLLEPTTKLQRLRRIQLCTS